MLLDSLFLSLNSKLKPVVTLKTWNHRLETFVSNHLANCNLRECLVIGFVFNMLHDSNQRNVPKYNQDMSFYTVTLFHFLSLILSLYGLPCYSHWSSGKS